MASSIDASTSGAGGVITTADNTGILQLKSGGTTIATVSSTGLALNTGNITLPSGAAPAFSAYQSSTQTLSNTTWTKLQLQTEEFDTNSNYDNATNYRFTPTVAGYYQFNGAITTTFLTNNKPVMIKLYKNGSGAKIGNAVGSTSLAYASATVSALIYMNGSTDYVELYGYQDTGGSQTLDANSSSTYFQAFLARSA